MEKNEYAIVRRKSNGYIITFMPTNLVDLNKWTVLDYANYYTDACRKTDRWKEKLTGTYIV